MNPILEELKQEGLELTEETLKKVVEAVFKGVEKYILATANKFDDLLLPLLSLVKPKLINIIEKINEEDNA